MGQFRRRLAFFATAAVTLIAATAHASITRVSGPLDLINESKVFVKFDAAFDSVNRVYLAVWGTQFAGPTNGMFLNEAGVPLGAPFAISDHSDGSLQAGWARVIYSAQEGKFLVSYTKILAANVHGKAARFVTYSGGPVLSSEITIASGYGHPGTESGIAYSVPARTFLVTWWTYYAGPSGAKPVSFVTAINPAGTILSPVIPGMNARGTLITNPNDGQADPEIACDPVTRHCLVVGFSWGTFYGGSAPPPALWARYVDDVTGAPLGADSFYAPIFGYMDSPTVSFGGGKFIIAYTGNGQVLGHVASGAAVDVSSVGPYYGLRVSGPATAALDGGGYRFPSLSYNSATNTTLLAVAGYQGYPVAQEIDGNGQPIAGALDFIPDPGPNYDSRTQYTIPVANNVNPGFLYLDNHFFLTLRSSRYTAAGGPPPPPPPPPCPVSLSLSSTVAVMSPARALSIDVNVPSTCGWSAASNASWMQITGNASATGPASVSVTVMRNAGASQRTGTLTIAGQSITIQQAAFNAASTHDMDGDGYSDLLWQYQPNGGLAMWRLEGTNVASGTTLPGVADLSWKVAGTGDLDGDGHADLVWQRTDGTVAGWLWTSGGYLNGAGYLSPSVVDPHWKIRGVGDLNGDRKADIVWQNDANGGLAVWFMNGLTAVGTSMLGIPQQPDPNWLIVGAGDISGDGKADILWQHQTTGRLAGWLMNGTQVLTTAFLSLYTPDLNWKVAGVGDVEGNGHADLLWVNMATGNLAVWTLSGFAVQDAKYLSNNGAPAVVDLNWKMVGPG